VAWCAIFVSYIISKLSLKWGATLETEKGFVWVPSLYVRAKQQGWITLDPEPGDITLFDWDGNGQADHVGFFAGWIEKGKSFLCIEGNTSFTNQSNGGEVMVRLRNFNSVQAFVKSPS